MSEVKKAAEKTEKAVKKAGEGKLSKIIAWFKNLPQKIAKPFRNMYYELKKVTWPSKHKLITYSIIVLLFMLFMGVVIGLLDMGASAGVRSLISATSGSTAAPAAVEEAAEQAAETAENAAETAAETAEEAAGEAKEAVEEAAETAEKTVEEAAGTAEKAAEGAAETAQNAAEGK